MMNDICSRSGRAGWRLERVCSGWEQWESRGSLCTGKAAGERRPSTDWEEVWDLAMRGGPGTTQGQSCLALALEEWWVWIQLGVCVMLGGCRHFLVVVASALFVTVT